LSFRATFCFTNPDDLPFNQSGLARVYFILFLNALEINGRHVRSEFTPICLALFKEIWLQALYRHIAAVLSAQPYRVPAWVFLLVSGYSSRHGLAELGCVGTSPHGGFEKEGNLHKLSYIP
jgi:hypothetical protein